MNEDILDKVILLNIIQTYREGMTENEVFEVACRAWGLKDKRKDNADYALAVYKDEVKGVFTILSWYKDKVVPNKWAFKGEIAPPHIRDKYIGTRQVVWKQGQKMSFAYINC